MEIIIIIAKKNVFLNEVAGAGTETELWVSCGFKTNNTGEVSITAKLTIFNF